MNIFKKKKDFNKKKFLVTAGILTLLILLGFSAFVPQFSGCAARAGIGNWVIEDLNGDGIVNPNEEPGIGGVTVELYNCNDKLIKSTMTNYGGYYRIDNLPAGSYYVKFILPPGYEFTLQDQGDDDTIDSDPDPATGKTICTYLEEDEYDNTWDAGLVKAEDCNRCYGKLTQLTLQYNGGSTAQIMITQGKDKVPFNEEVDPDEEFTIYGMDGKGTLGKEIKIYVDDVLVTKIHTSCSRPIGPGMVFGDFTIIEGYSQYGGLICPYAPSERCECWGKVTQLTLQYNGGSTAQIMITQGKDKVPFNEEVDPDEEFTIYGMDDKGTLGKEIKIYVNDILYTKIHTSCSKPIGAGMVIGDFTIIEGYSKDGGKLCPYKPLENSPCWGKVTQLTLSYGGTTTAQIKIEDKKGEVVIFDEEIDSNEEFTIYGFDDKGTLGSEIMIYVDDVLHTNIHTSCSQPIYPGLVSGDFTVIEGYSLYGGKLPAI